MRLLQLTALSFALGLTGVLACSGDQGCGGAGADGSASCGAGTRWDGTQCVRQ